MTALTICGCQVREEGELAPEGKVFTATMETLVDDAAGVETKTVLDSRGNVLWKQGDQVSVFAGSTINEQYQVTDASDGKTAAALNRVTSPGFVAGTEIQNNVAFYPYGEQAEIAKDGSTYIISGIEIPATQTYASASFGNGAFPMVAVTSSTQDYNLKFKNVQGGLKLQLTGTATIASISIAGNNSETLCGASEVTVSTTSAPSISLTDASATTVTLDCGDGVQLNETTATAFILALPPMTMEGGFTVTVTDTEGATMEIKTTKTQTITRSNILSMPAVTYEGTALAPVHEAVDLGLPSGLKWATCNIGANAPTEYGDYFAWGATEPYYESQDPLVWKAGKEAGYTWPNCPFRTSGDSHSNVKFSKYITSGLYGPIDNKIVLDPEDDAAYVNWGGTWRMPTDEEWTELRTECTWTWTTQNGVNGRLVTGPNGNSIFLPAAGQRYDTRLGYIGSFSGYWSSSLSTDYSDYAGYVYFRSDIVYRDDFFRYDGRSVRAVSDEGVRVSVSSISLNQNSIALTEGSTESLTATVTPSNATQPAVIWSSSNTSVATVDYTGVVTAVSEGFATITATTYDGGYSATCAVTVISDIPESTINLSTAGTANCYIVPSAGTYSFLAVKGNSAEPIGEVKGVKVLWETFGTTEVPEVGSIIAPTVRYSPSANVICFETNDNYKQGSALIAAFSDEACSDGNVLWSWHLWCTSDDLTGNLVNLRNNAGTIMDRNLGATTGIRSEYSCFSLLYQYGRKDPFIGGCQNGSYNSSNNMQQAASTGVWNTAEGTGYENAVMNPTTFFSSWANGDDTISWSEQKNIYDPCPPGYRVPDKYVYAAAAQYYYGESSMWDIGNRGTKIGWYNGANYTDYQSVWFPNTNALYSASSLRSHRIYGSVTRDGAVWTCGGSFYSAMYDGTVSTVAGWQSIPKETGNAVRCVTESSPIVVNTESVSVNMNSVVMEPYSSFDLSATVYPTNANVNSIRWDDLSDRFTMTNNTDGSVQFTDNKGYIGKYYVGAYSPLALYGMNDEWRIRWDGSLAEKCEVTVCPSEPLYDYYGGWYLKAKAGDTISFSFYVGDDDDGHNDFSVYVGGRLVYEDPYQYSSCQGDFSYTFEEAFTGWLYLCWGWACNVWNITTTASVLGRGEKYPDSYDLRLNDRWVSQTSYKFEYSGGVLTMN